MHGTWRANDENDIMGDISPKSVGLYEKRWKISAKTKDSTFGYLNMILEENGC